MLLIQTVLFLNGRKLFEKKLNVTCPEMFAAMNNIQSNILRWKQNSSFYSGLITALLNKDDLITCSYSNFEIIYPVVLN